MFDLYLIYRMAIRYILIGVRFVHSQKKNVATQLKLLGTAAYTSAFVYAVEKGVDLNAFKLTACGVLVVALAEKLNK